MIQRIAIVLVVLAFCFIEVDGRRRGGGGHGQCGCPGRNDDTHWCCDCKIESEMRCWNVCERRRENPDNLPLCFTRGRHNQKKFYLVTKCKNVTWTVCTAKCCEGYELNDEGECDEIDDGDDNSGSNENDHDDDDHDIACENGGTPDDDECHCPNGFIGNNCETPVCYPQCQNSGSCSSRNGVPVCVCPEGQFEGDHCQTPVCNPGCENGGYCQTGYYESYCVCPDGYEGESCQGAVKEGDCPYPFTSTTQSNTNCSLDRDCPGTQKCCGNGEGWKVCTNSAQPTCTYNGVEYDIYDRLDMTACKHCICLNPDNPTEEHQWLCTEDVCPVLSCEHQITFADECCPVCDIQTSPPPTSTFSPITTCYDNGVYYQIGAVIRKNDGCEIWTCVNTVAPEWQKMVIDCFMIPECINRTRIPGQCCEVCNDVSRTTHPTTRTPSLRTTRYPTTPTTRSPTTRRQSTWTPGPYTTRRQSTWTPGPYTTRRPTTWTPRPTTNYPTTTTPRPPTKVPTTTQPLCILNDQEYPVGSKVSQKCETCTCIDTGIVVDWVCLHIHCPVLECEHKRTVEGQCCQVCDDATTAAPVPTTTTRPSTGPQFTNCPRRNENFADVVLHTNKERFVDIRKQVRLTVRDSNGMLSYEVDYSKEIIFAQPCNCTRNMHLIIAKSKPDRYGRFASCSFLVHVFDNHAPVYNSCPSNIAAFDDEVVTWDKPSVSDNIAIMREEMNSRYKNNSIFAEGTYAIMYVAKDHQQNFGICQFVISIFKRGSKDPSVPLQLQSSENRDMTLVGAIIGAVIGLIVLIAAVVLAFIYCKRNRANSQPNRDNAYNNGIYAEPYTPPPSYGRSFAAKLPPKYLEKDMHPPMYEELDIKVLSKKKGVDNPIYDSTDELDVRNVKLEIQDDANA